MYKSVAIAYREREEREREAEGMCYVHNDDDVPMYGLGEI